MKTCRSFFSLIVLSAALAAQSVTVPKLEVEFAPHLMRFHVTSPQEPFLGAVILSLSSDLVSYGPTLPRLLSDFVLVDIGLSMPPGVFTCSINEHLLPPGMMIYAQGVTFDGELFRASAVRDFVLDVTVPQ